MAAQTHGPGQLRPRRTRRTLPAAIPNNELPPANYVRARPQRRPPSRPPAPAPAPLGLFPGRLRATDGCEAATTQCQVARQHRGPMCSLTAALEPGDRRGHCSSSSACCDSAIPVYWSGQRRRAHGPPGASAALDEGSAGGVQRALGRLSRPRRREKGDQFRGPCWATAVRNGCAWIVASAPPNPQGHRAIPPLSLRHRMHWDALVPWHCRRRLFHALLESCSRATRELLDGYFTVRSFCSPCWVLHRFRAHQPCVNRDPQATTSAPPMLTGRPLARTIHARPGSILHARVARLDLRQD